MQIVALLCVFVLPVASFDAEGAAKWALGCVDNCPDCTCKSNGGGAGEGFCAETDTCDVHHCACGCTPFVSTALIKGGNWKHDGDFPGFQAVCAEFQDFMEHSDNWKRVKGIHPGDVVVMTTDKYAGHCCIGTGHGVMSCHNRAAKNVKPSQESHEVDGIYRHSGSKFWNASELVHPVDAQANTVHEVGVVAMDAPMDAHTTASALSTQSFVAIDECSWCKDSMNVVFNLIFDTYACDKPLEEAIKLVCTATGPFASACKEMITLVCKACKHATKDQCSWQPLAADACQDMGFCSSAPRPAVIDGNANWVRAHNSVALPTATSSGDMQNRAARNWTSSGGCRTRDKVVAIAKEAAKGEYSIGVCGHCGHYRCDCSGLVSYAWGLGGGDGPDTAEFPQYCDRLDHWSELQPGDALLKPGEHVLMFLHWLDKDAKTFKEAACHDEAEGCSVDDTSKAKYEDFYPCRPRAQYVCSS